MPTLFAATNGLSVWMSKDLGETMGRAPSSFGIYSGSQVWALEVHPTKPNEMLVGTNYGVHRFNPETKNLTLLKSFKDDIEDFLLVTAIAYNPHNPDTIIVGTQPSALFRSDDAGKTWRNLKVGMKPYMTSGFYAGDGAADPTTRGEFDVKHWTRVTGIMFDPKDPKIVYAGVEIDGAWRSTDGGETFERSNEGFKTADIHGFGMIRKGDEPVLFATTNEGLYRSTDHGLHWEMLPLESKWQYTRQIVARQDGSGVMYVTNGNGPPGTSGKLFRSKDFGSTWDNVPLPAELESSLYFLAVHPSDPKLIFAAANLGQMFRSIDGGMSWTALQRRLPEVRALTWLPD